MLATAQREYDAQQRLTALALAQADRYATRGSLAVAQSVQTYQATAVSLSLQFLPAILAEQGISSAQDAATVPASLLTGVRGLAGMFDQVDTPAAFLRLVQTMVGDASRTARAVDQATRPAVTSYVRSLRPPSCSRCAILAGRVYTVSTGFQRHPQCDCLMTPTSQTIGPQLVTDPLEAFRNGQIKDLSRKDAQMVLDAAPGQQARELASVVNIHRKGAGLSVGSSVIDRPSPQDLMAGVTSRIEAFAALRQAGYITAA